MLLPHLPDGFTAVVTGAGGGIGHAIVNTLSASQRPSRIIAVSRSPQDFSDPRIETLTADISQQSGRTFLQNHLDNQPVHLLFNAVGMLHDASQDIAPEKRMEDIDAAHFAQVMHVNAATPVLLLASIKRSLQGKHPVVIGSLSARVGSITDNGFGGWYSYRASKAAHNMLMKTFAIELKRFNKQAIVLCLHPGTTDTPLSQPFQSRVPEHKLFTPEFVADSLLDVMSQRTPEETGSFWDWAGDSIEW